MKIEGLEEIRKAIIAEENYADAFAAMMENADNDGVNPPKAPKVSSKNFKKKYPKAAAYLWAESWNYASNDVKSSAGSRAMERIEAGEDYEKVLKEMQEEWSTYVAGCAWN